MANESGNFEIGATTQPAFRCEITTWQTARLSLADLTSVRKQPESHLPTHITPQFLKNSDDQTVASLIAFYSGFEKLGVGRDAYHTWGIVSASQYIGRGSFAATLHKYCKDGPWGVSVQVIPHNMLHSVASTISLTLPCVGPCLGAGGGRNGEIDALMLAINLLAGGQVPGVWVTWSYWEPDLSIDEAGKPQSDSACCAVAMALVPATESANSVQLELRRHTGHQLPTTETPSTLQPFPQMNGEDAHSIVPPRSTRDAGRSDLSVTEILDQLHSQTGTALLDVTSTIPGGLEFRFVRQHGPLDAPANVGHAQGVNCVGMEASA